MSSLPRSSPGPDGRPTNAFERFERAELEQSISARFERQVARHAGGLAIKVGAAALSYAALDRAANRIAHAVLDRVGPGNEPVALLLPQGIRQVAAVLGTLKAGKIYVPLDPAHAAGRLAEAVADTGTRCVLTAAAHANLARRAADGAKVLDVEALDAGPTARDASPGLDVGPDAGAYIFYTSGSTGRPKGVLDTHRNVLHNVMRYTNSLHLGADDRLTLLQGPSFSGAVSSLFGALLNGAAVFPFDVIREGADRIAPWLAAEAITVYHSVPALFRQVAPHGASLPALRVVRLEGDRASVRDLELFRTHWASDCVLVNGLGATECGLVRQFFFTPGSPLPERVAPIGEPVEDMEVVLLDKVGRPVPEGEIGEIAVRSRFLAAGYWKRPELTAEHFLDDPEQSGMRVYRTGDAGRLREDGLLEHLGGVNGAAKVRGQRVELADVEAALLALPGVAEAAAAVHEDSRGEQRLVAYLVPGAAPLPAVSALRQALAARLPDFMVPSAFVTLERLPLTDNRKMDRRALPPPTPDDLGRAAVHVEPRTALEITLSGIWQEVLGLSQVGVDDDFFVLGGHSLLAAQLITRLRDRAGVEVPFQQVFETPTIAGLARAVLERVPESSVPDKPEPATLRTLLEGRALRAAGATAIAAPGRAPLSYRELLVQVDDVRAALTAAGLGRGARIALALPQGPEMATALLAVASTATCVPLNPVYVESELELMLGAARLQAVIVPAGEPAPARSVAVRLGLPVVELVPEATRAAGRFSLMLPKPDGLAALRQPPADPAPDDVAVVLHTSGTTARPKRVPLTHTNLLVSARGQAKALGLSDRDRCLNVMPLFHVNGLAMLLASLQAEAGAVCPPLFDATRFLGWVDETEPTWYNASPTIHQAILTQAALDRAAAARVVDRCPLRFVRSASAPLPARVMHDLEQVFKAPVIESYGQTETATLAAVNPLPPRTRKPGSVGISAGPGIALVDADGRRLPPGQPGEIVIRGPNVMAGYEDEPDVNRASFADNWFRTGDLGRFDGDGYLYITGRLKDVINRGGEKISPREIDDILTACPGVREALAFALPHPTLGEDVAAAVVAEPGASLTAQALRRFVAARVADFKVPRQIALVPEIPKGPTGKPDRAACGRAFDGWVHAQPAAARDESAVPGGAAEAALRAIWCELLNVETVSAHDDFFALGGDSILAGITVVRLRAALGVEVSLKDFFETPTLRGLAGRIVASPATVAAPDADHLQVAPRDQAQLPLSFAQEQLWLLDQILPETAVYNIPYAVRFRGDLDVPALQRTLAALVARHEVLRTTFASTGVEPVQIVGPPRPVALPLTDLGSQSAVERERTLTRRMREEAERPFDLARDVMLRAALFRLGEREHVLLLVLHHIASDGWSMGVLMRELEAVYHAERQGRMESDLPDLPALPIQYADWAVWQRRQFAGIRLEAEIAHWRTRLAGAPAALELPTDRPRPPVLSPRGAEGVRVLPATLADALRALAREERATLFMALFAGFQVLLHRYTGVDDLVVATAVAGRPRREVEPLIGYFVNTLALRTDLSGDPTFRELLRRVREVAIEAYVHQEVPFHRLVQALAPERHLDRSPLVQIMLVLQDGTQLRVPCLSGLEACPMRVSTGTAKFDLSLSITEGRDGLEVVAEYSTDLFEAATIERLLGHYARLLEGVVMDPDRQISALPLMTDGERTQIAEWSGVDVERPADACLHHLVEARVAQSPEKTAVVSGDAALSYGQLDARATGLARRLRRLGVGPDVLVAVCMHRSLDLVVALLAVLKAGGAYVPLDPETPPERLRYMLEDAAPAAVLADHAGAGLLSRFGVPVVCPAAEADGLDGPPAGPLEPGVRPEHLAYVIYTSGSTGRPKGVMVPHRAIVNHMLWMQETLLLTPEDVVLQRTPIGFDASVWEFWGPLMAGALLVMGPVEAHHDPAVLVRALAANKVTVCQVVPSFLRVLLEEPELATATHLRRVLCGGETLLSDVTERFFERLDAELINLYGPTEATIDATWWRCRPGDTTVPIGRPISNARAWVLDGRLQPLPVGVPGELWIGGVGVARGYLNQPALTEKSFVPDRLGVEPGARLYRTGDRARYRADGTIEFLGRLDRQVKIRGHRIELEEVEAALLRLPEIGEAAVVVRGDRAETERLVGFIVPASVGRPAAANLRQALRQSLPDYMVPATFVTLERLPVTSSGKVDRGALPDPGVVVEQRENPHVPPRSPLEHTLVEIWEDLLAVRPLGIRDSFFDLGGHSLLAVRMMEMVERFCGRRVPLTTLFTNPTIEHLAEAILSTVEAEAPLVALNLDGTRPPFFFLHGDLTGGGFYSRAFARALGPDQPFYAVHPHGLIGDEVPASIEAMAADRLRALRAVRPAGPYLLGGLCNGALVALEMAQQLVREGDEVRLVVLLDATAPPRIMRILSWISEAVDHLFRVPIERRGQRLRRWWMGAENARAGLRYYGARLATFARGDRVERLASVGRMVDRIRAALDLRSQGAGRPQQGFAPPPRAIFLRYADAMKTYVPPRYPGRLVVLRAESTPDPRPDLGWSSVSRHVVVHTVPGDHITSISRHVETTAARLRACLEAEPGR